MENPGFAKRILVLACLLVFQQAAYAADETLVAARQQLAANQAKEAYALLAPLQSRQAGDAQYDYLLGLAALESGKPNDAIFAFERVLALEPNNINARIELARAYYLVGEKRASREEFETVRRQQPADQANRLTEKYLRSIDQAASGTQVRGYVEASIGYDSNVNSATSAQSFYLPSSNFTGPLGGDLSRRSDRFSALAAGLHLRNTLSSEWAVNATANIGQRFNDSHDKFDVGYLDTSLGMTRTRGEDQFTGSAQYQKINVHKRGFRHAYGILGLWQRVIDDQRQFTVYGQLTRLNYDGVQKSRDADRYLIGTTYSQRFAGTFVPVLQAGLQLGEIDARRSPSIDEFGNETTYDQFGYKFAGLRLGGQLSLAPSTKLVTAIRFERRRYDGKEPSYLSRRADRQMDYSIGVSYMPTLFWTIKPEVLHTRNGSNLDLYDYSRTQYWLSVRRDFN